MEHQIEQGEVSYLMHESDMARSDRNYKRLWLTLNGVLAVTAVIFLISCFRGLRNEKNKSKRGFNRV